MTATTPRLTRLERWAHDGRPAKLLLVIAISLASTAQAYLIPRFHIIDRHVYVSRSWFVHEGSAGLAIFALFLYGAAVLLSAYVLRGFPGPRLSKATWSGSVGGSASKLQVGPLPGSWSWLPGRRIQAKERSARLSSFRGGNTLLALAGVSLSLLSVWLFAAGLSNLGLIPWLAGLVTFTLSLRGTGSSDRTAGDHASNARPLPLRGEALVLLVLAAGVFFRFYRLDTIPPGINNDAAWNGLYAIELSQGGPYTPYSRPVVPGGPGRETMFHYLVAASMDIVGPTPLAIKLTSAVIGAFHLLAFYLLGRELLGTPTALVATSFLAASGWHITLSKAGWRVITLPLFESITFYFLLRGLRSRRPLDFSLAGIALGLCLNTYYAGPMTPTVVALFLLFLLAVRKDFLNHYRVGLASLAVATAMTLVPMGVYAGHNWGTFTQRSSLTFVGSQIKRAGSLEPLFNNLVSASALFNVYPNGDDFFTELPLLDFPVSVFFILGLVYCLLRWRQPGYFLILAWFFLSLGTGVLSVPNGNRTVGTITPVYLMAGLFLTVVTVRLLGVCSGRLRFAVIAAIAILVLAIAWDTYHDYIGPERRYQFGFYEDALQVGEYVESVRDRYHVHLTEYYYEMYTVRLATYRPGEKPFDVPYDQLDLSTLRSRELHQGQAVALLLRPPDYRIHGIYRPVWPNRQPDDDWALGDAIRELYPQSSPEEIRYPPGSGHVVLLSHLIPAGNYSGRRLLSSLR